jgi:hypothetical protein
LGLWCHAGLVFSKTLVKNQKSVMDPIDWQIKF